MHLLTCWLSLKHCNKVARIKVVKNKFSGYDFEQGNIKGPKVMIFCFSSLGTIEAGS